MEPPFPQNSSKSLPISLITLSRFPNAKKSVEDPAQIRSIRTENALHCALSSSKKFVSPLRLYLLLNLSQKQIQRRFVSGSVHFDAFLRLRASFSDARRSLNHHNAASCASQSLHSPLHCGEHHGMRRCAACVRVGQHIIEQGVDLRQRFLGYPNKPSRWRYRTERFFIVRHHDLSHTSLRPAQVMRPHVHHRNPHQARPFLLQQ